MSHEFQSSSPAANESERPRDIEVVPVERQTPRAYQVVRTEALSDPSKKGKEKTFCENNGIIEWIAPDGRIYIAMAGDPSVRDMLESEGYTYGDFGVDYSNGQEYNANYILGQVYACSASNEMNRLAVERGMQDRVIGAVPVDGGETARAVTDDRPFGKGEYNFVDHGFTTLERGESGDTYRQGVGTFTSEHGIITCVTSQGRVLSFADSDVARKRLEQMHYTETNRLGVWYANPGTEEDTKTMKWLLESR